MRLKKQQEPTWLWRYKNHSEVLLMIWSCLTCLMTQVIPDTFIRALNLPLNFQTLDFMTGKTFTDPAAFFDAFFLPTDQKVLRKKKNQSIEHTVRFPQQLGKPQKPTSTPTSQDLKLQEGLSAELQEFCLLGNNYRKSGRMTSFKCELRKVRPMSRSVLFTIPRAVENQQGARVITLVPETYPDPSRPSATEGVQKDPHNGSFVSMKGEEIFAKD